MEKLDVEVMEDFWDELPTNRCGEDGCNACVQAFHNTCHPLLSLDAVVHVDPLFEADTDLDIRALLKTEVAANYDPEIDYDLGGG